MSNITPTNSSSAPRTTNTSLPLEIVLEIVDVLGDYANLDRQFALALCKCLLLSKTVACTARRRIFSTLAIRSKDIQKTQELFEFQPSGNDSMAPIPSLVRRLVVELPGNSDLDFALCPSVLLESLEPFLSISPPAYNGIQAFEMRASSSPGSLPSYYHWKYASPALQQAFSTLIALSSVHTIQLVGIRYPSAIQRSLITSQNCRHLCLICTSYVDDSDSDTPSETPASDRSNTIFNLESLSADGYNSSRITQWMRSRQWSDFRQLKHLCFVDIRPKGVSSPAPSRGEMASWLRRARRLQEISLNTVPDSYHKGTHVLTLAPSSLKKLSIGHFGPQHIVVYPPSHPKCPLSPDFALGSAEEICSGPEWISLRRLEPFSPTSACR